MLLLLEFLCLSEYFSNSSQRYSVLHAFLYYCFSSSLVQLSFLIFVTLHSVGLSRTSLSVSKDGSMEPIHNLPNESLDLELVENLLLTVLRIDDLVKLESFPHYLRRVLLRVLFHTRFGR